MFFGIIMDNLTENKLSSWMNFSKKNSHLKLGVLS